MSKAQFVQRRDGRVAALQYLYAWSLNTPKNLTDDLRVFFEHCEEPREHYSFGEELIHGVIEHCAEIDAQIKALAQNWDFDRIAKIDLAILRIAGDEDRLTSGRKPLPSAPRTTTVPPAKSASQSVCSPSPAAA